MLFKLLEFHLRKEIKSAKINHSRLNKLDAQHSKHANREKHVSITDIDTVILGAFLHQQIRKCRGLGVKLWSVETHR